MRLCRPIVLASLLATALAAPPPAAAQSAAPPDAAALIGEALDLAAQDRPVDALEKASDAYFAVWDRLPLSFRRVELVSGRPDGYDQFDPRDTNQFDPGQQIFVYVDPIGFGWRESDDGFDADLTADFILSTGEGRIIAGQKGFGDFPIHAPQRGRESFLLFSYKFSGVPAGAYVLTTTVHDRVDGESASFDVPITIN